MGEAKPARRIPLWGTLETKDDALRAGLAALSGALLILVSPPTNLWFLHYVSFVPVLLALRQGDHRKNMLLGYFSGVVGNAVVFFWITDAVALHSNLPYFVAVIVLGLFSTVFALPYAITFGSIQWFRQRIGGAWVFLFPAVAVAAERLSPALFPHYMGSTQYRMLPIWQLASVTGVMGLTYLLYLSNAVVAEFVYARRYGDRKPGAQLGILLAILGLDLGYGIWRTNAIGAQLAEAPVLRVAFLQQNVTMVERMASSPKKAFLSWVELTRKVVDQRPDLVVWPEGAFPANPNDPRHAETLGNFAVEGNFDFLVGGGTYEKNPEGSAREYTAYNSCYHFTPEGEIGGRYDKMVPLPFGEYLPLSDTFPVLKGLIEGIGDFRKGTTPTAFHARDYTFSAPICYEAILDSAMWKLSDVDVLVNITNDAWFGNTAAPHQHAMLAAVQAIQFGRPMLRIAYTGVCMVIEPDGSIPHETEPFTEVAEVVELRRLAVDTLYRKGGWLFPWICVGVSALAFLVAWQRGKAARIDPQGVVDHSGDSDSVVTSSSVPT